MISLDVIEREISELEARETSYAVCERLAWLYTVRDHMAPTAKPEALVQGAGGSEFMAACAGKPVGAVLAVLDEHMEAQRAMYPRVYEGVIRRLREL